jgi:hypothetical protein
MSSLPPAVIPDCGEDASPEASSDDGAVAKSQRRGRELLGSGISPLHGFIRNDGSEGAAGVLNRRRGWGEGLKHKGHKGGLKGHEGDGASRETGCSGPLVLVDARSASFEFAGGCRSWPGPLCPLCPLWSHLAGSELERSVARPLCVLCDLLCALCGSRDRGPNRKAGSSSPDLRRCRPHTPSCPGRRETVGSLAGLWGAWGLEPARPESHTEKHDDPDHRTPVRQL